MRVQVHLRAEKLTNIASGRWRGRKSNPYATVSLASGGPTSEDGADEVGKTEVMHRNLSPNWAKIFIVDHDEDQSWTPLKITIKDSQKSADRSSNANRSKADSLTIMKMVASGGDQGAELYSTTDRVMGEVDVEVGEVLRAEGQEVKLELLRGGCIYVHITESMETKQSTGSGSREPTGGEFHCHLRGLDLENIEKGILGLGAIDPYFEISKKYTDHRSGITKWTPVYRSEHIPNIINPYWHPFQISLEKLCHGDLLRELKITIWDHEHRSKDRWLGETLLDVEWLQNSVTKGGNASREDALVVLDEERQEVGLIVVLKADIL